jgi:beta-galactosidase
MKRKLITLIFTLTFSSVLTANETLDLNGKWNFKTDPYRVGESNEWFSSETDYTCWNEMDVPGNWDLYNEYSEYAGDAWYNRSFFVDESLKGQSIRIVFQSVYNDCKLWINGRKVGENHLGFLPFHYDISEFVNYGMENHITLVVNNVFKRGAIWNWGGIRRPVWLEITNPTRLEYQHITAIPDLKRGTANVNVKIVSSNSSGIDVSATLEIEIQRRGERIAKHQMKTVIPAYTQDFAEIWTVNLPKSKVELWHTDFPNLYTSTITLIEENQPSHSLSDRFGIRKLEVVGGKLMLNGEEIRPVGFNVVPEDRMTGNTLPMERIREDVDMLKELGVTMCRISHLPIPKEYLDYLDEKGIMTFEEVSLWGKDQWVDPENPMPKQWLSRMIREKYNHPSVVGWSVGNEIGFPTANPKVFDYVKGAVEMAKSLDKTRLVVYISHSADSQMPDPVEYSDLIMLNKYGNWGNAAQKAWELHQKPVFMSEFGNVLNHEDPNLSHIEISRMMEDMRGREYLLGVSPWTFNDYRSTYYGREGWATPVSQNRCWGIVNTFRQKKRSYYEFKKEFAPVKRIHISEINESGNSALVTIIPRDKTDIPAKILRAYKVCWHTMDEDFNIRDSYEKTLAEIYPGDEPINLNMTWNKKASGLKVEISDPQGYSVLNEVIYFNVPLQPEIIHASTAHNGMRIIYQPVNGSMEYFVRYSQNGNFFYSDTTINNFVTINDNQIKLKDKWEFEVFAMNNAGVSDPSEKIELIKDEDELPPIIWATRRVGESIVIGYTSLPDDYLYEVEYGNSPGQYDKNIIFKNRGVARIPGVQTSVPVYLRLRVRKQWGFASEWSQEIEIL